MAGLIEVNRWRNTHVATQIDPHPIYVEAKRIDGDAQEGTYATSVFQASKNLGLIPQESTCEEIAGLEEMQFVLHRDGVCLLGFVISTDGWAQTSDAGWIGPGRPTFGMGHMTLGCWYQDGVGVGWQNSWLRWGVDGFGRMNEDQFREQYMCGLAVKIPR